MTAEYITYRIKIDCVLSSLAIILMRKRFVNWVIFVRVLFSLISRMRSIAKIKSSRNGEITVSFTDVGLKYICYNAEVADF